MSILDLLKAHQERKARRDELQRALDARIAQEAERLFRPVIEAIEELRAAGAVYPNKAYRRGQRPVGAEALALPVPDRPDRYDFTAYSYPGGQGDHVSLWISTSDQLGINPQAFRMEVKHDPPSKNEMERCFETADELLDAFAALSVARGWIWLPEEPK